MRAWRAGRVVAAYLLVVGWLTWPLAAHLGTHLPDTLGACRFDALLAAWAAGYESHALTTMPARFLDANIYHPAPEALLYCEAGLGALPVFFPAFALTGNPALALNLTLLLPVALTAAALHLLTRRWTGSTLAGCLAAWTFLTTRWTLWDFLPTAPNYAVLPYLPAIIFLAARPARRFGEALRLLPLIVLQSLCSVIYMTGAAVVPLAVLALGRLARRDTRRAGAYLVVVLALSVTALLPYLLRLLAVRAAAPDLPVQTVWAGSIPPVHLPWGPFVEFQSATALPPVAYALIGAGGLGFVLRRRAAVPAGTRRIWQHGALWAVTGLILALTPVGRWNGTDVDLPLAWLARWLPIVGVLRVPGRMGAAALMGCSLLTGAAFAECARRLTSAAGPRRAGAARLALAVVVAGTMYAQYVHGNGQPASPLRPLPAAYPLAEAIDPAAPLVRALRRGAGPVLELPLDVGGIGPAPHAQAMYRSLFHWRPILNGYCSYWPAGYRERIDLALQLPDAGALAALRRLTGLTAVVVHGARLSPEEHERWMRVVRAPRPDLRLTEQDRDELLFAVLEPPAPGS